MAGAKIYPSYANFQDVLQKRRDNDPYLGNKCIILFCLSRIHFVDWIYQRISCNDVLPWLWCDTNLWSSKYMCIDISFIYCTTVYLRLSSILRVIENLVQRFGLAGKWETSRVIILDTNCVVRCQSSPLTVIPPFVALAEMISSRTHSR